MTAFTEAQNRFSNRGRHRDRVCCLQSLAGCVSSESGLSSQAFLRLVSWSIRTAATISTPIAICRMKGLIPRRSPPFLSVAMIRAPNTVPRMVRSPPMRLAPPTTAAAMASNSYPSPAVGIPLAKREVYRIPAMEEVSAENAYDRMAVGARVVPPLEIGIDDPVRPCNNCPARLGLPGGRGHRRCEDLRCRQDLRSRLEFRLLARQIGGEVLVKVCGGEEGEAVGGLLYRSFLLLRGTGHALSKGAFVLSDIGSVSSDVHEPDDMRVDASLCDNQATVAVTDKDARARLQVEDPLRRGDVVLKRRERFLYHLQVLSVLGKDFVDRVANRAVDPSAVDEYDVFDWVGQRGCSGTDEDEGGGG